MTNTDQAWMHSKTYANLIKAGVITFRHGSARYSDDRIVHVHDRMPEEGVYDQPSVDAKLELQRSRMAKKAREEADRLGWQDYYWNPINGELLERLK